ncbi:MAG: DUF3138 family protein [Burkholderiales bacterium]|nr:DUF3138 family protein [Burkholderiales bacterium]
MKNSKLSRLLALSFSALPVVAYAQTNAPVTKNNHTEIAQELSRMQQRIQELEAVIREKESQGMTPEQERELNRLSVLADAQVDNNAAMGIKGLKISGYIDPTYIATRNQNRAGFQFLNSSTTPAGAPEFAFDNGAFGSAMLDFQKEMDSGTKFRLTLMPNRVGAGNTIDGKSIVHEASIWMPIKELDGTRLLAGQIPSWEGYEFLESYRNKLISHNLLFDLTIPASFTGFGVEKALTPKYTIKTMLANVNASKKPNGEKSPALVFRADYFDYAQEFTYFALVGMVGKLTNYRAAANPDGSKQLNPISGLAYDARDALVTTLELEGGYTRGDWSFAGQVSIGAQKHAAITADAVTGNLRDSRWWGASGTIGYKLTPQLEGLVRLDYFNNKKNGGGTYGGWNFPDSRTGLGPDPSGNQEFGTNRSEITFGLRYNYNLNTMFKLEYRYDKASLPVFLNVHNNRYVRDNQMLGAAMILSF